MDIDDFDFPLVGAGGAEQHRADHTPAGFQLLGERTGLQAAVRRAQVELDATVREVGQQAVQVPRSDRLVEGLDYVSGPAAGRIGRSSASVGDLVGPNSGNLTTLVSIDPIEALFQVSEATYISAISRNIGASLDTEALRRIEVSLELTTGVKYPEVGKIDYFANRIDQSTGTLEARARIPNPHGVLVPGQYVRVILRDTELLQGLFVPQAAVQADQQGSFVLTVDGGNMIVRRNVELGHRSDDMVLVRQGVDEGDVVVVRGLQQVRPGMPVK